MDSADRHWEHFPHPADVGVRGRAPTLAGAFEQAAMALTAVVTEPSRVRPVQAVAIRCRAQDPEVLLFDWLNQLIYQMSTRGMLFGRFEVAIDGEELRATAWGELLDRDRHQPVVEPKAATFAELRVFAQQGAWVAQAVVDV